MALVEVERLVKHFPVRGGFLNRVQKVVHAVNGVSLEVERGETLGIVGESGCGKSTLGKTVLRLLEPTAGSVRYSGSELTGLGHRAMIPFRRRMQVVFQDPYSSLNPRLTVGAALAEVIRRHRIVGRRERAAYIAGLLEQVGLRPSDRGRYPHEFSGGQRQRIGIARALALRPEFIVADEPVSALDVSIQAQILNLLMDLKRDHGLTILFISHDLKVVEHFCDRVLVMYLGHVVETLHCDQLHTHARHPYTQALLAANPVDDPDERGELPVLEGDVPSPFDPPPGCPFSTRCPIVEARCREEMPPLEAPPGGAADGAQEVACWKADSTR